MCLKFFKNISYYIIYFIDEINILMSNKYTYRNKNYQMIIIVNIISNDRFNIYSNMLCEFNHVLTYTL